MKVFYIVSNLGNLVTMAVVANSFDDVTTVLNNHNNPGNKYGFEKDHFVIDSHKLTPPLSYGNATYFIVDGEFVQKDTAVVKENNAVIAYLATTHHAFPAFCNGDYTTSVMATINDKLSNALNLQHNEERRFMFNVSVSDIEPDVPWVEYTFKEYDIHLNEMGSSDEYNYFINGQPVTKAFYNEYVKTFSDLLAAATKSLKPVTIKMSKNQIEQALGYKVEIV